MTTQPQSDSAHLRAAKELNAAFNLYAWEDSEKECAAILAKHFPAPPALTFDRREALGKTAYEEHRLQTEMYDSQMPEWKNLPNGTQTEWRNVGEAVAAVAHPAPPALTGGDNPLLERLYEEADAMDTGSFVTMPKELRQAAARITALSAQVAEAKSRGDAIHEDIAGILAECEKYISLSNDFPWAEEVHCAFRALAGERDAAQAQVAELKAEGEEQARLLGKSGSREAAHLAKIAELERDKARMEKVIAGIFLHCDAAHEAHMKSGHNYSGHWTNARKLAQSAMNPKQP